MSTENITSFLQKSRTDAALGTQVKAVYEQAALDVAQALAKVASEHGLPFTAEEFLAAQTEVSEKDLEGIAGGMGMLQKGSRTITY